MDRGVRRIINKLTRLIKKALRKIIKSNKKEANKAEETKE